MRRGEVRPLRLPKGMGHEQRGRRYGVVVQADALLPRSMVLAAPTSRRAKPATFRPEIAVEGTSTRVLVEQMGAVDISRLGETGRPTHRHRAVGHRHGIADGTGPHLTDTTGGAAARRRVAPRHSSNRRFRRRANRFEPRLHALRGARRASPRSAGRSWGNSDSSGSKDGVDVGCGVRWFGPLVVRCRVRWGRCAACQIRRPESMPAQVRRMGLVAGGGLVRRRWSGGRSLGCPPVGVWTL